MVSSERMTTSTLCLRPKLPPLMSRRVSRAELLLKLFYLPVDFLC
jgi:hypothetical protein